MKTCFSIVGQVEALDCVWVDLDVIPRLDEHVKIPNLATYETTVRTVVWNVAGVDENDNPHDPYVYIVLGRARS